jgi:hypothetical protein
MDFPAKQATISAHENASLPRFALFTVRISPAFDGMPGARAKTCNRGPAGSE